MREKELEKRKERERYLKNKVANDSMAIDSALSSVEDEFVYILN